MLVKVEKGKTVQTDKYTFQKISYALEDDCNLSESDLKRQQMENVIDRWLAEWETKVTTESVSFEKEVPKGSCKVCGKTINPKYTQCYECFTKHQKQN